MRITMKRKKRRFLYVFIKQSRGRKGTSSALFFENGIDKYSMDRGNPSEIIEQRKTDGENRPFHTLKGRFLK
ncbi:MAG: hypothetical protein IJX87_04035 [Clostridia bacterium]|nr:hypothetical protein [Clostridia bacterium]